MSISNALHGLTLLGILGVNVQMYSLIDQSEPHEPTSSEMPAEIAEQLADLERLKTENATLQLIARHASFNAIEDAEPRPQAQSKSMAVPPLDWTLLPPFPASSASSVSAGAGSDPARTATSAKTVAARPKPVAQESAESGEKKPSIIFRPIRMREDGALLYLASDGNIRVAREGGQLYGVNGRFIAGDGRRAVFEIAGRKFPLPLIGIGE